MTHRIIHPFHLNTPFPLQVYQRVSDTQIRLSQSVGAACGLQQTFFSSNYTESAAVALTLTLSERLCEYLSVVQEIHFAAVGYYILFHWSSLVALASMVKLLE